jgi:hypothetical protein
LATTIEAKRNCGRVTDRGKAAWSVTRGPTYRNRIRGGVVQGERACNREALVAKERRRKSGGRAGKGGVLTRGDLALGLKGSRGMSPRSEKSAEVIVVADWATKDRTERRAKRP